MSTVIKKTVQKSRLPVIQKKTDEDTKQIDIPKIRYIDRDVVVNTIGEVMSGIIKKTVPDRAIR